MSEVPKYSESDEAKLKEMFGEDGKEVEPEKEEPKAEIEPEKKEDPKLEVKEETPKPEGEGKEPEVHRPLKYIPIPKYQADKKEWDRQKSEFETKIEELNAQLKKPQTEKTDAKIEVIEDEIKDAAEKLGVTTDQLDIIVKLARKGLPTIPEDVLKKIDEANKMVDEVREKEQFTKEWDAFTPIIKESFDNASDEQKSLARELMDKLSHSPKYVKYELDYVFYKEREAFDEIFSTKKRKGIESGRLGKDNTPPKSDIDDDDIDFTSNPKKAAELFERKYTGRPRMEISDGKGESVGIKI